MRVPWWVPYYKAEATIVVAILVLVGLLVWAGVADERAWRAFSEVHHCRVVATSASTVFPVTGYANGRVTTSTVYVPGTTTYLCDDGVRYTR